MPFILCSMLLVVAFATIERAAYQTGLRVGRLRAATELLREANRLRDLGKIDKDNALTRAAIDIRRES